MLVLGFVLPAVFSATGYSFVVGLGVVISFKKLTPLANKLVAVFFRFMPSRDNAALLCISAAASFVTALLGSGSYEICKNSLP